MAAFGDDASQSGKAQLSGQPFARQPFSRRTLLASLGVAAVGFSLQACGSGGKGSDGDKLNFYTWDTYIGETTLSDFQTASGVKVQTSYFSTNDELFAKLKAGNPGYDVIVPSNPAFPKWRVV